ncbi:MAG: hypothetical protein M3460_29590 [Actinomycetota bacterium]|nr:hypothetical protein [Actinomycetota bacterium]
MNHCDFTRQLDLARDRARDRDLDLAIARGRDIVRQLIRTHDRAHDLIRTYDLDLDVYQDLAEHLARAHDLAISLDFGLDRDRAFARILAAEDERDFHRDLARDLAQARTLIRALARDLDHALDRARTRYRPHDPSLGARSTAEQDLAADDISSSLGRLSQGLLAFAVRVLPAPARPRYQQEFSVELRDMPQRERLGYALRVLTNAWKLRRALTQTARSPDVAPIRPAER